ncbi:hypothetical protein BS47DRAFT_1371519 [Hydnum rufescens UP504]|uniref:WD40 repeat-like protein n=1 Tax=Hydnum rufescens UP504 TaxID=1448309 RepID=A0A9P6E0J8_9AGAM|nr:hypothetical protein BS47DRAFT_1371519 [Hydnum rufescens UP504]
MYPTIIAPRIKRDFLKDLPIEIALHIISFIQDPRTLARASAVNMCRMHKFCPDRLGFTSLGCPSPRARVVRRLSVPDPNEETNVTPNTIRRRSHLTLLLTEMNWRHGGRVLKSHTSPDDGTVTNVSIDDEWILVSLTNRRVHVFSAETGDLVRNLVGHLQGIWALHLGALAITGSCDRDVRVWDVRSGYCLHVLKGHTSTVRCVKALDGRPIAVSGARDGVIRVWDIQKGICLRVLEGHESSVRALDIAGNVAITGSYDHTARLWNVDTGEYLFCCFDGKHLATGSLDSTVRLWDAESGECMALLQGHTSLVGNLQILDGDLVTGGSDGRVIIFSLRDFRTVLRICAHDNSVTTMQVDNSYLMTGGNDGCVKLFERETGTLVRELTERCDGVWKVVMRKDKCVIMCKRGGRTVIEVLSFGPTSNQI